MSKSAFHFFRPISHFINPLPSGTRLNCFLSETGPAVTTRKAASAWGNYQLCWLEILTMQSCAGRTKKLWWKKWKYFWGVHVQGFFLKKNWTTNWRHKESKVFFQPNLSGVFIQIAFCEKRIKNTNNCFLHFDIFSCFVQINTGILIICRSFVQINWKARHPKCLLKQWNLQESPLSIRLWLSSLTSQGCQMMSWTKLLTEPLHLTCSLNKTKRHSVVRSWGLFWKYIYISTSWILPNLEGDMYIIQHIQGFCFPFS